MATALQLSTNGAEPTYTVEQGGTQPVVEPLGGFPTIDDVMAGRFPEEVYDLDTDTHLYRFLQGLCGDQGAGSLKSQSYISRLKTEASGLVFSEIDTQYSSLRFPRLSFEFPTDLIGDTTGQIDPSVSVLTTQEWDQIEAGDNSYLHRIQEFLQSTRMGNSPDGISLAAESGCGVTVDVWETYKSIYASLHDEAYIPSGGYSLPFVGLTKTLSEFVLMPHAEDQGNAYDASFTRDTVSDATFQAALPVWTEAISYAPGDYVTASDGFSGTLAPGHVFVATAATGASNSTTEPDWSTIINDGEYGDFIFDGDSFSAGVTWVDAGTATVNDDQTVNTTSNLQLDPERERNMVHVVDNMRPVGALMTIQTVVPTYVPIKTPDGAVIDPPVMTSSANFHLNRFVTGKLNVTWPTPDEKVATENNPDRSKGFFIEAGIEKEQKNLPLSTREKPTINHTIEQVVSYSDLALDDFTYGTPNFIAAQWDDFHTGVFHSVMQGLFPALAKLPPGIEFRAFKAIAVQNTPLIFEKNLKAS